MISTPDWSRLAIVPVTDDRILAMDRGNGRWAYLPIGAIPLVELLPVDGSALPDDVRDQRDSLAMELQDAGLGGPRYSTPNDLNTVIIKMTKACNYACTYCYDLEPEDKMTHLSVDMALEVLNEALELAPQKLGVIFHGGEPTLFFDKIKEIALAGEKLATEKVKDVDFYGQTNLSRLDQGIVEFSFKHRVRWGISLDGPPPINDRFRVQRNGSGTYQYFEKALDSFPEFVRSCGVMSVITAQSDAHILQIARHFRDLGIPSWDWSLFFPMGQGRLEAERFQFSIDRLLDSWNELFDAVLEGESTE